MLFEDLHESLKRKFSALGRKYAKHKNFDFNFYLFSIIKSISTLDDISSTLKAKKNDAATLKQLLSLKKKEKKLLDKLTVSTKIDIDLFYANGNNNSQIPFNP